MTFSFSWFATCHPFLIARVTLILPFCSLLSPEILSTKEETTDDTIWRELCAFVWPGKEAVLLTRREKNMHEFIFLWFLPQ